MVSKVLKFTGGSLSGTYLCKDKFDKYFVRKLCSLNDEREYGLVRLFSQKTKITQNHMYFPDLFPRVLDIGVQDEFAYVDFEYLKNYVCLADFLLKNDIKKCVLEKVFENVYSSFCSLSSIKSGTEFTKSALELYFKNELFRPLEYFKEHTNSTFTEIENFSFNGNLVPNILKKDVLQYILNSIECNVLDMSESLTHGNLTIENIMINPDTLNIVFIDCYEENYFHTKYNDLSQLLQCSKYLYSWLTRESVEIDEHRVNFNTPNSGNVVFFNELLDHEIKKSFSSDEIKLVEYFLLSQFTRMLPFKIKSKNYRKAMGFFCLACKIYKDIVG